MKNLDADEKNSDTYFISNDFENIDIFYFIFLLHCKAHWLQTP